jgi:PAS domain S-box-containing protein
MHGRTWILRTTSLPSFEATIDYSKSFIVLASGVAISLLLCAIIWSLSTLRVRAVTLARRMTEELRESREQLSLAIEGSDLALFDWNVASGEIELSARWAAMLGGTPQATVTTITELSRLVHPDDMPRVQQTLRSALRGESALYEVEHRVKDQRGGWIWILSRAKVTARDAAGIALRVTGTNANITQRKQVEQMKDQFISTVNHEVRTPLTVIVGSLALLKEDLTALPADKATMLDMACQNSVRLQSLVNDILDFEKIGSGAMRFRSETVALGPLLHRSLELNRMYAERFKVRYELVQPVPQIAVTADGERLLQVMTNLLSNAAKFSPEGQAIAVALRIEGAFARVSVTDDGPGVPVEFRGRIFGKFAQADSSNTRRQGGSGLGLSISKTIIESMGGHIGFDSVPGQGATFYFELPLASSTPGHKSP